MSLIQVEIVSAEEAIFSGVAKFIVVPGESGELGILPGHIALITKIKPGIIRIELEDGTNETIFAAGGILEIQPHIVTILADTAVRGHNLNEATAMEAKRLAEEVMSNKSSAIDFAKAQSEFAIATAQLAAIAKLRKKSY